MIAKVMFLLNFLDPDLVELEDPDLLSLRSSLELGLDLCLNISTKADALPSKITTSSHSLTDTFTLLELCGISEVLLTDIKHR